MISNQSCKHYFNSQQRSRAWNFAFYFPGVWTYCNVEIVFLCVVIHLQFIIWSISQ